MIREKNIRSSVERLKGFSAQQYSGLVLSFADKQPFVSRFIDGGHYRIINRTERGCLNYYCFVAYLSLRTAYGEAKVIGKDRIEAAKDGFLKKNFLTISKTREPVLENYLKVLIHADQSVRPKSVLYISAAVCAFIQCYVPLKKIPYPVQE